MPFRKLILVISAIALLWSPEPSPAAQERLPLFDTHVHYSRPDWDVYPPAQILKILAAAGVKRIVFGGTSLRGNESLVEILRVLTAAGGREAVVLPNGEFAGALGAMELAAG